MPLRIWEKLDLMTSTKELNDRTGSMVYILLHSSGITCTTRIIDINKFMESENILEEYLLDNDNIMLLHALILNNQEVPNKIPDDLVDKYKLACIKKTVDNKIELEELSNMDLVVEFIEDELENPNMNIEDFVIILYKKAKLLLQSKIPQLEITAAHKNEMGATNVK